MTTTRSRFGGWAVALLIALGGLLTIDVQAAGTATVTTTDLGGGLTRYRVAWTSTAGGAVSGNAFGVVRGQILQVKFVPGTGGSTPTTLYDATLVDADGVDVLGGAGANLSATAGSIVLGPLPMVDASTATLDLVIANAGDTKAGTVTVLVGR